MKMERYIVPSVYQAIQLCRALGDTDNGLSSVELEQLLAQPRTTVFRLLKTLCSEQLIEKRGKRYFLANTLYSMGTGNHNLQVLQQKLVPQLAAIIKDTDISALLCVPSYHCALVIDVVSCAASAITTSRPGSQLSLMDSAPGHIMLSYHPRYKDGVVNDIAGQADEQIARICAQTCTRGYASSVSENQNKTTMAVPVLTGAGALIAIIALEIPAGQGKHTPLSHWVQQLKSVAVRSGRGHELSKKVAG